MKRFFVAALLLSIFGASGTKANSESGTISNPKQIQDSIVITSNRFATPIEKIASSVTVLSETDIENSKSMMLSDLLKQVPGLDVVRSGGAGTQTSIFMRGTSSSHTLVLIDGIEMNNPSSATTSFDFGSLNVSNIQRIEILRGPQSVLYGSDAVGGVIQIFTKRGFGDLKTEISSEAGSYGSFSESIHLSGSKDKIDFSIFGARKDSEGFSTIREDAGGFEKDGFESTDIIANLGMQLLTNYELTTHFRFTDATADIDGSFGVLDDPNFVSNNKMYSVGLKFKSFVSDAQYFKPTISIDFMNQDLNSVNEEDANHFSETSQYDAQGRRIKLSATNLMKVSENLNSIVGVEYEKESFNSEYQATYFDYWNNVVASSNSVINEVSATTISLFGLDEWAVNEQFSLSGGVRYDNHEDFGSQVTYRFTSLYNFPSEGMTLKAVYGTAFKAPSLYQLNHNLYGNQDLQPEENKGWEIGFEKSTQDKILRFGATYFSNAIDNLIGFDASFKSININEATSKGVEAFAQISFPNSSVRMDVTYTDTKDVTNGSRILRRPKEKISFTLNQKISQALQASVFIHTVGNRFDTDFRPWPFLDEVLDGYTIVNLSGSYQILDNLKLNGRVDNLFNEDYQDVLTYNTPNRSAYLGLKISL